MTDKTSMTGEEIVPTSIVTADTSHHRTKRKLLSRPSTSRPPRATATFRVIKGNNLHWVVLFCCTFSAVRLTFFVDWDVVSVSTNVEYHDAPSVASSSFSLIAARGARETTTLTVQSTNANTTRLNEESTPSQFPLHLIDVSNMTSAEICESAKTNFRSVSGLFVMLGGLEHSGTTILSSLIQAGMADYLMGPFEGGFALAHPSPRHFINVKPFYQRSAVVWHLNQNELDAIMNTTCHAEMYLRIRQYSRWFRKQFLPTKTGATVQPLWLMDKAPRYGRELLKVMEHTPGVPVIVTEKNWQDQLRSFRKQFKDKFDSTPVTLDLLNRRDLQRSQFQEAIQKYPDRLLFVNMTLFYEQPRQTMQEIFSFLKLPPWKDEYFNMEALNARADALGMPRTFPFDPTALHRNTPMTKYTKTFAQARNLSSTKV